MIWTIILAIVLRLPFLGQSLWLDEAIEALAMQGRMGPILSYALADFQPPLYHGLLYIITQLFGTSEIALRLPSFLAGLGVVYLGGKLAERLGGKKAGLITGLLLATSPLLIYYSVEGRTYKLTTFFATLSFWALIKSRNLTFAVATIGIVWTSYLGWLVVALQAIYLLITKKRQLLLTLVLSAATIVFWLPSFLGSLGIGISTLNTSPAWGQVVGGVTIKSLPLTWVKFVIGRIGFDNKIIYGAVAAGVFITHLIALLPSYRMLASKYKLVIIWLVGPITLGLIVALFVPVYQYFRLLFVLPAYLILLGTALADRKMYLTYLVLVLQLAFLVIYATSPRFHHEDWRKVVADYGADATYALPSRNQNAPLLYYGVPRGNILEPKIDELPDTPRIIYLRYAEELFDQAGLGRSNLTDSGYTMDSEASYPGIAVEVYNK
jgi:mannosyltransferase